MEFHGMDTDTLVKVGAIMESLVLWGCDFLEFSSGVCYIESVPFRGCNCTDAAGREFAYKDILKMLEKSSDGRKWDENSKTPYFHYVDSNNTYQVWYDDPESLHIKYKVNIMSLFHSPWHIWIRLLGIWT